MWAEDRQAGAAGGAVFPEVYREASAFVERDYDAAEETWLGGMHPVELGKVLRRGCQPVGVEAIEPDDRIHIVTPFFALRFRMVCAAPSAWAENTMASSVVCRLQRFYQVLDYISCKIDCQVLD